MVTRIYLVILEDRHTGVQVEPFYQQKDAIARAKAIVADHGVESAEDEEPVDDWLFRLFHASLSTEGDCVRVEAAEIPDGLDGRMEQTQSVDGRDNQKLLRTAEALVQSIAQISIDAGVHTKDLPELIRIDGGNANRIARELGLSFEEISPANCRKAQNWIDQHKEELHQQWLTDNENGIQPLTIVEGDSRFDRFSDDPVKKGELERKELEQQQKQERIALLKSRYASKNSVPEMGSVEYNNTDGLDYEINEQENVMKVSKKSGLALMEKLGLHASEDKLEKRLNNIGEYVAEDAKLSKEEQKLVDSLRKANEAGQKVEVVEKIEKAKVESNGKYEGNGKAPAKSTAKKKTEVKVKKEAKVKSEKKVKTKPSEGVDKWGTRLGTSRSKINAVIGKKPLTVEQIAEKAGLDNTFFHKHMTALVEAGHVKKTEEGFILA